MLLLAQRGKTFNAFEAFVECVRESGRERDRERGRERERKRGMGGSRGREGKDLGRK